MRQITSLPTYTLDDRQLALLVGLCMAACHERCATASRRRLQGFYGQRPQRLRRKDLMKRLLTLTPGC
jgi:hypothetical protein